MDTLTIYLGNKAYSSWSLRAWLMLKHTGAAFREVVIPLEPPGTRTAAIRPHSPTGRVPAVQHGELTVWESLAVGEYLAELFPAAKLWPEDRAARAVARCVSSEMLSSFASLRSALPMNVRRVPIRLTTTPTVKDECARITSLWKDCRTRFGGAGPFLFGRFGIADAMFAPVATRFQTYGVDIDAGARAYVDAIFALPAMREWIDAGKKETWSIEAYESIGR